MIQQEDHVGSIIISRGSCSDPAGTESIACEVALAPETFSEKMRVTVAEIYEGESRRVLATLIRLLGDFDLAEEALHDAFTAALEQWQRDGVPSNPRAWLVSTGRFKAIDNIRRRARFDTSLRDLADDFGAMDEDGTEWNETQDIPDERLRLI